MLTSRQDKRERYSEAQEKTRLVDSQVALVVLNALEQILEVTL